MNSRDAEFLRRAIAVAAAAPAAGGRPFGSLLVDADGKVLIESHNTQPADNDITAHPELKLARWAAATLTRERAATTTMYTSCEPCGMCAVAIETSGLGRVVYALSSEQFGDLAKLPPRPPVTYDGPALFDEARAPIDAFFTG